MLKLDPFKTIEFKKDWQDYIQYFDYYDCNVSDGIIFLIDYYAPKEILEKIEKFFDKIERNSDQYFVNSWENVRVDYEDNCAYDLSYYGSPNFISTDDEIIGKRRIDKEWITFEDLEEDFINNSDRAFPNWYNLPESWQECSCDYASGWYGRNDRPEEILEKMNEKGYDVVFKISYQHMFECGYCVYFKEKENNEN